MENQSGQQAETVAQDATANDEARATGEGMPETSSPAADETAQVEAQRSEEDRQTAEINAAHQARIDLAKGVAPGRVVLYTLTQANADEINRRRGANCSDPAWPQGAVAHIGNYAYQGDVVPVTVVRVWGETGCLNGQATLDGNDSLWLTSILPAPIPTAGSWHWPTRV